MSAGRHSLARRSVCTLLASALVLAAVPRVSHADPSDAADSTSDVENSRFQFDGVILSNDVFVRSGPSDNDYATTKLNKGDHVTVVGIRFDWLKILPPPGSFCYVAKAYTERRGDGAVGRVTNALNVHVGSDINSLKVKVAKRLEANTDVQIVGEQDEYFKIKPPAGVYYYVNKQYVAPVQAVSVKTDDQGNTIVAPVARKTDEPTNAEGKVTIAPAPNPETSNSAAQSNETIASATTQPAPNAAGSTTQPAEANATTQPSAEMARADFDKLETDFAADTALPLEKQHPAELAADYDKLAKKNVLPDSMQKVAVYRAAMLKLHADDQKEYLAVRKQQDEDQAKMASLRAERQELEARVQQTAITYYAAVGTLRPSSLQQGQQMLYRLTDPATGRTVLYVRSNDDKLGSLMNQFIGVKGTVTDDSSLGLKVIDPTSAEPVDQSKLYTSVMANIVPPSLQPVGQASTATP